MKGQGEGDEAFHENAKVNSYPKNVKSKQAAGGDDGDEEGDDDDEEDMYRK